MVGLQIWTQLCVRLLARLANIHSQGYWHSPLFSLSLSLSHSLCLPLSLWFMEFHNTPCCHHTFCYREKTFAYAADSSPLRKHLFFLSTMYILTCLLEAVLYFKSRFQETILCFQYIFGPSFVTLNKSWRKYKQHRFFYIYPSQWQTYGHLFKIIHSGWPTTRVVVVGEVGTW